MVARSETRDHHEGGGTADATALLVLRADILCFHAEHPRSMAWRETRDPYAVMVSEVMLQQTQVSRVQPKYAEFLDAFPGFGELASAPLAAVLEVWSGLGYNRRAVNLRRAGQRVVDEHGGVAPTDPAVLATLPGIGPATAKAVATYAFGAFAPFIETNVRAVLLHHFFAGAEGVPDRVLAPIVDALWDPADPRMFGYALMDYGAWLKRAVPNPSRRSRHHTRQSRFEGSDRQARASFVRALVREGALMTGGLASYAEVDEGRAECLLGDLQREGLVARDGDGPWRVAD
jgi:A/G-specific adenine glycosylase